jgi:endonuclease III
MASTKRFQKIVDLLAKKYEVEGKKGELTELRDPFQVGAWYILGQHSKRNGQARAFEALRRAKGVTAGQLLDIAPEKLAQICQQAGPYDDSRARDLYAYADAIEEKCGKDFAKYFKKPLAEVRKFLEGDLKKPRAFADLMLMHAGFPVFALNTRVARVATRLGFGKMKSEKDFEKVYKDVQKNLEIQCGKDAEFMIRAHGLLFRLGTDTCHSLAPACYNCPLVKECEYVKKHPVKPREPAEAMQGSRYRPQA